MTLNLEIGPYWWFGGEPGEPLPDLSGFASPKRIRRTKDGQRPPRPNHSKVLTRYFRQVNDLNGFLEMLFGPLPDGEAPVVPEQVV